MIVRFGHKINLFGWLVACDNPIVRNKHTRLSIIDRFFYLFIFFFMNLPLYYTCEGRGKDWIMNWDMIIAPILYQAPMRDERIVIHVLKGHLRFQMSK